MTKAIGFLSLGVDFHGLTSGSRSSRLNAGGRGERGSPERDAFAALLSLWTEGRRSPTGRAQYELSQNG